MLKVGILVDLGRGPHAGGHVKCWERFAEASVGIDENIDLTVHFQGSVEETIPLGPKSRIVTLKPVFSSERLFFLRNLADYTDLARNHRRLKCYLENYDVIHTTDGYFAYAHTAAEFARQRGIPLVNSLHTNTPGFTKVYSDRAIRRTFGDSFISRLLINRAALPDRFSRYMEKSLRKHLANCSAVLASENDELTAHVPDGLPCTPLRRGIYRTLFHPNKSDANKLRTQYGIPDDVPLIAFVGRLDGSKNVMTLAHAAKHLLDHGQELHLILAGKGYLQEEIEEMLGGHVSFAGTLSPQQVAHLNASSDLFVFPSTLEVWPNAVLEAKACGTAIMVAPGGGNIYVSKPDNDGIIVEDGSPTHWATMIDELLNDPAKLARIGAAARKDVETKRLSWEDVLREDLIPVWRQAANQ
jgi:glycosyltransferase involved in cell wall biosynthesis